MPKKYKHIFFDLDHTLWDFERNANECLAEIYEKFSLKNLSQKQESKNDNSLTINNLDDFLLAFDVENRKLWSLLDKRLITHQELRKRRFKEALAALEIEVSEDFSDKINEEFLRLLPQKSHLIDGALEVLDYLLPKYHLHIITNGFDEIQATKIASSEIQHYFGEVITNEKANARKPEKEMFEFALKTTNSKLEDSIMIGDNYEADILGAISAGMDTIFYNPAEEEFTQKPTFEISHLLELKKIL
jgi:YjjG family noncanonical pyrimidine nucleotidase